MLLGLSVVADAAVLIIDGKSLRASANADTGPAHLLAAMTADGRTAAQVRVGGKISEIAAVAGLLVDIDITGCVISADALHPQRATAEHLTGRGADDLLILKADQPTLIAQAIALPWAQAPVLDRCRERARARGGTYRQGAHRPADLLSPRRTGDADPPVGAHHRHRQGATHLRLPGHEPAG